MTASQDNRPVNILFHDPDCQFAMLSSFGETVKKASQFGHNAT